MQAEKLRAVRAENEAAQAVKSRKATWAEEEAIQAEQVKHDKLEDVRPDDNRLVLFSTVVIVRLRSRLVTDHLANWISVCVCLRSVANRSTARSQLKGNLAAPRRRVIKTSEEA